MTKKEYALFVEDEMFLANILTAHKKGVNIDSILKTQYVKASRLDNQAKKPD